MDMQKTGDFIHAARKKLNMSQRALGEYLRVTDKAVSKWETRFPKLKDTTLKPMLTLLPNNTFWR